MLLLSITIFLGQWFAEAPPEPSNFSRDQAVQDFLRQNFSPGTPALSYFAGDLVRAGLETPITNPYHYAQLIRKGALSDQDLVNQLQARRFGVVVLNFDLEAEKDDYWANYYLTGIHILSGQFKREAVEAQGRRAPCRTKW